METINLIIMVITVLICSIGWFVNYLRVAKLKHIIEAVRNGDSLDKAMKDYGVDNSKGKFKFFEKAKKTTHC